MKAVLSFLLTLIVFNAAAQPKDIVRYGLKGKVKQLKIDQYKFDLPEGKTDSAHIGTVTINFDEDGNVVDEETKHLETGIVMKKVYWHNPKKLTIGYDQYVDGKLTASTERRYKDDYVVEDQITSKVDKSTTRVTSIYNPDYRLKKVVYNANKYDEYKYDDEKDATTITRTEFEETSDVIAEMITKRDGHGNPLRQMSGSMKTVATPYTKEMTYTYY